MRRYSGRQFCAGIAGTSGKAGGKSGKIGHEFRAQSHALCALHSLHEAFDFIQVKVQGVVENIRERESGLRRNCSSTRIVA